jgi:hypothetical protein
VRARLEIRRQTAGEVSELAMRWFDSLDFLLLSPLTNSHDEVLARAVNLLVGRAAYETARRMYPKDLIEYRHGAQIIERSDRD